MYIAPVLFGGLMVIYPALMQLTFTFTSLLGLTQAYFFRQPWARQKLGIQPLPVKPQQKTTRSKDAFTSYAAPWRTESNGPTTPDPKSQGLYSRLTTKARQTVAGPIAEVGGAVSELKKSMTSTAATEKRKHGRTAAELRQAKIYEEKYGRRQKATQSSK